MEYLSSQLAVGGDDGTASLIAYLVQKLGITPQEAAQLLAGQNAPRTATTSTSSPTGSSLAVTPTATPQAPLSASAGAPIMAPNEALGPITPPDYTFSKAKPVKNVDLSTLQLLNQNGQQGLQFFTNKGNAAGIKDKEAAGGAANPSGFVTLDPNAQYRITNEAGKNKVLYTGTGEEGLKQVYAIAQNLSATGKKKANWGVEMLAPGTDTWRRVADDDPAKNIAGKIAQGALNFALGGVPGLVTNGKSLDITLPIALSLIAPGVGGLAGALGGVGASAAGAALGSVMSGIAQGRGIGDIAKGALMSGGLSYLGGTALQGLGVGGQGATKVAEEAAKQAATNVVPGAVASGAANAVDDALSQIIVTGVRGGGGALKSALTPALTGLIGGAGGSLASGALSQPPSYPDEITVTRGRPTTPTTGGAVGAGIGSIVGSLGDPLSVTGNNTLTNNGTPVADSAGGTSLQDIVNYLRLGGLAVGTLGNLFGGSKNGSSNGTIPGGLMGNLGGIFSGSLPTNPIIPGTGGGTAASLGARTMPAQDWTKYGMRPEQSFFNQVPSKYTPPAPGQRDPKWDSLGVTG